MLVRLLLGGHGVEPEDEMNTIVRVTPGLVVRVKR